MKFNALLSILLYDKVVLLYLVSGHSHMLPDRVVSMLKKSITNRNVYHPKDIAERANAFTTKRPFFIGWDNILNKYFNDMPAQYTFNFYFELDQGVMTIRRLTTTPAEEAFSFNMLRGKATPTAVRRAILSELFNHTNIDQLCANSLDGINLQRHPGCVLTDKKIASLSAKYSSIPTTYLNYYPVATSALSVDDGVTPATKKRTADQTPAPKVGRPKKVTSATPHQPSILAWFGAHKAATPPAAIAVIDLALE